MKPKKTNSIIKLKILEDKKNEVVSKAMPEADQKLNSFLNRTEKLELEHSVTGDRKKVKKTITEDYRELSSKELDDIIDHASFDSRLKSGSIDLLCCTFLATIGMKYIPQEYLSLMGAFLSLKLVKFILCYLVANYFVCTLPMMFFRKTIGMKIQKIKLRSKKRFLVNNLQCFMRETFLRPLLFLSFLFLSNETIKENKMALYDKLSRTVMVVD